MCRVGVDVHGLCDRSGKSHLTLGDLLDHIPVYAKLLAPFLIVSTPHPRPAQYVCTETEIKGTLDGKYCMEWTGNIVGRHVCVLCVCSVKGL